MKTILRTLILAVVLLFLGWFGHKWYAERKAFSIEQQAALVEQQVRTISQYATAEATRSSMFKYTDRNWVNFPGMSKQAIIRASARMVMGFELENVTVTVDHETQTIVVENWPEPSELAFELSTDYFDLQQGVFNTFEPEKLNEIEDDIEQKVRAKINRDDLIRRSYDSADNLLGIIRQNLETYGWSLKVEGWLEG